MTGNNASLGGTQSADSTENVRDELTHDAARLKDRAKDQASQKAEGGKQQATQAAKSAATALQSAAQELRDDQNAPDWLAKAVEQGAGSIKQFAGQIENREVGEIVEQVRRFAQTSPGSFLAASAAAGFAAARVLRAGADHRSHGSTDDGTRSSAGASPLLNGSQVPNQTIGLSERQQGGIT